MLVKSASQSCNTIWVGFQLIAILSVSDFQCRVAALSGQTAIFCLTVGKHLTAERSGWSHTAIISLIIRDGAYAFITLFGRPPLTFIGNQSHPIYFLLS